MEPSVSDPRKVFIIGAGLYGLVAAKTYLEINPEIRLTIIDADSSIGGVWSRSRIYPGLVADHPAPVFEFSDLHTEELGIPRWSDLTGEMMHAYLEHYAAKFGILQRCRLSTEVIRVERENVGWKIWIRPAGVKGAGDGKRNEVKVLSCDVLIMATGICSKPRLPDLDTSAFGGLILHTKDLQRRHEQLTAKDIKKVVVVGGNKSSLEAVSMCANAGKTVHWLIRRGGSGPGVLVNARRPDGNYGVRTMLCRITDFMKPTVYGSKGWWDYFVVSGKWTLGSKFFKFFWEVATKQGVGDRYERSENGRLLKPDVCK